MKSLSLRWLIISVLILVVIIFGLWFFLKKPVSIETVIPQNSFVQQIGSSVQSRKIEAYSFGQGNIHLAFVGGIHGGYEWNSVLLAYQAIDYLTANPEIVPANLTVTIIPNANPDGVFAVTNKEGRFTVADVKTNLLNGTGRFNANQVDLNRNFACNWQATSTWKNNIVSAGTTSFSEPEAKAIRDFVLANKPKAVVFWHSQSNAVYASECNDGILPETLNIMTTYAQGAKYPAVKSFDSYKVTGDAEGWLASINIPAITVELQTHETIEWERNLAGIKALFDYYKVK